MGNPLDRETIEFAQRLHIPGGERMGEPLRLMDVQREFFELALGGKSRPRQAYLSLPRRCGKTVTMAILVVAALLGPLQRRGGVIVSAAMKRDQAALIYKFCRRLIELSGLGHLAKFRDSSKTIEIPSNEMTYKAISADASSELGEGIYLAVVDEIGQIEAPTWDLFDTLETSMGSYSDSLLCAISTQAPTDAALFSLLLDDAMSSDDPSTVAMLRCAPDDADIFDPETWHAAIPGLGAHVDLDTVAGLAEKARRLPTAENSFRNLILNQRVQKHDPFVSAQVWRDCDRPVDTAMFYDGRPVYGGLDLSQRIDLSALVLAAFDDAQNLHIQTFGWTPEEGLAERAARDRTPYVLWNQQGHIRATPGPVIDYDWVAADMARICTGMNVAAINYDRKFIEFLMARLSAIDCHLPLTPCGQGYISMHPACDAFLGQALQRELIHGGNPLLTMAVTNAVVVRDPVGQMKIDKSKSYRRIDPAVAAVMAAKAAIVDAREASFSATHEQIFAI